MNILVLGADGMAGHTISLYFIERGYDITTYTTKPFNFGRNIVGNAFDKDDFEQLIKNSSFDVIINCIGLLNETANSKPSMAIYLNSFLPHYIADITINSRTKLIQMSTDCVFAGNTGPYYENSFKDGITFYDKSKALGEVIDDKNLTFRNSIIGPDMNPNGIGLFNWFMQQKGMLKGYTGAKWTGVTTLTLAKAMEFAIRENLSGLYNLVNNSNISKYELLCLFNSHFKDNSLNVSPDDNLQLDKSLINTRNDFSFKVPFYEEMIVEMKEWIQSHSELYPHYYV